MPRLSTQQTNFTAGEISPRLYGRTEIDKYGNAVKSMVNAHAVVHGGAVRRAGSIFAKAAKYPDSATRMIDFVVSQDVAFMLEFGDHYIRVFSRNGVYITEVATSFTVVANQELDYTQYGDTMFLWHVNYAPQRLRRMADGSWNLAATPFTVQPFAEQGHALAATLTLSGTTGTITATAASAQFLPSDTGRQLIAGVGIGTVTYTDSTHLSVVVTATFGATVFASGAWYLDLSPYAFLKATAKEPAGATLGLFGAVGRNATLTLTAKTGAITINASAAVFVAGDTGLRLYADSGDAVLTYVNATQLTAVTATDFLNLTYPPGSWGITGSVFRAGDVGKYVRMNGGMLKITQYNGVSDAYATIVTAMTSTDAAPPLSWSMEASVWSSVNGYPRTGTIFEQRLWCAGNNKYPSTIWGSRTGLYLDFTLGTADSDACSFTVASDEANPITFLAADKVMLVLTFGGEFTMQGGVERPITPSNVQIKPQTRHGSALVRPVSVGNDCVFVQRAGLKVRAMSYEFARDKYTSPDITVLAEHITRSGIVSMAWQQEPDRLLWLVLGDGTLVSCTLDRDPAVSVTAWARHYTEGAVESVACMPAGDFDQVWISVRRTVNGAITRYVEYLDTSFAPMLPGVVDPDAYPPLAAEVVYGTTTDCSISFDNAVGQTVFNVPHLVGKTVDIVADGSVMPTQVVGGSGNVTLTRASYRTLIGLHFRSEVGMLTPEVGTGTGTAQGNSVSVREITLRFLDTIGAEVYDFDGRLIAEVEFKQLGGSLLDKPPVPFSGLKRVEAGGWERGRAEITIVQDQPLPLHLSSVIRKLTVND